MKLAKTVRGCAASAAAAFRDDPAGAAALAFAFFAAVSLPLGRLFLAVSLAAALATRNGRAAAAEAAKSAPFRWWAAFFAVAVVVSAVAAASNSDPLLVPARGLRKIGKLAWMAGLLAVAVQAKRPGRAEKLLRAFAAGAAATAVWMLAAHPAEAWVEAATPDRRTLAASVSDPSVLSPKQAAVVRTGEALGLLDPSRYEALQPRKKSMAQFEAAREALQAQPLLRFAHSGGWKADSFGAALAKRGTMADAQRLMLGVLAALVLALAALRRGERRSAAKRAALAALVFAGLLATCKRGPLAVAALAAAGTLVAAGFRTRLAAAALAALVLAAAAVPQVRARFAGIPGEFSLEKGGRARMWLVIAPQLHRERPFGIGFRALTYGKMVEIDRALSAGEVHVEVGRTHVHSTPLQAWVDLGWAGLAVWILWMSLSLRAAFRGARGGGPEALAAPVFLSALVAYSLVEYNLADAEIALLYALALGLAAAGPVQAVSRMNPPQSTASPS